MRFPVPLYTKHQLRQGTKSLPVALYALEDGHSDTSSDAVEDDLEDKLVALLDEELVLSAAVAQGSRVDIEWEMRSLSRLWLRVNCSLWLCLFIALPGICSG